MKGRIVSKSLQEAGLTPQEGMQVYLFKEIVTIRQVVDEIIYLTHAGKELQSLYTVDQLKTILVEYENKTITDGLGNTIHYRLPLMYSDWQTAINQRLVDSGKEVEFEIRWSNGFASWIGDRSSDWDKPIAGLVQQQNEVEKLQQKIDDLRMCKKMLVDKIKEMYTEEELKGIAIKFFCIASDIGDFDDWWKANKHRWKPSNKTE